MIYSTRVTKADGQEITEYRGLHNDIKPYENLNFGDIFYELDRDFVFKWNGTTWVRLVEGDSEGGGGNEQFVVNITMTYDDGQYVINSADKTYEQLASAVESGKIVMLKGIMSYGSGFGGYVFAPLTSYTPLIKAFRFSTSQAMSNSDGQIVSIICDGEESDTWTVETLIISR